MIVIENTEEMKKYYNEETNTYVFDDDVEFVVGVCVDSNIVALNIIASDINAYNITACDINARDINAEDIIAGDINVRDIIAGDIIAGDIDTRNIDARNINACDINAYDIHAKNILYHAVCFAYKNIICETIKGKRDNAKHFVLDGKITIGEKL